MPTTNPITSPPQWFPQKFRQQQLILISKSELLTNS
jgi:hypothetical protein